jgi:hypothetical protein
MLRVAYKLILVSTLVPFLGMPCVCAEVPSPLGRPVSVSAMNSSLSDYLLAILRSAGVSGGIAIVNDSCEGASEQFPEFKGNVQDALERLAAAGHHIAWSRAGGSLVIHNTTSVPTMLRVMVREFKFSRKESLAKASSTLLDTPEARDEAKALRLIEYGPELGFAKLQQPSMPSDIATFANITVLDALNEIAGGHAVWLYKESRCERNIMSLSWPVR